MQISESPSPVSARAEGRHGQGELSERFTTRLDEFKEQGAAQGLPQGQGGGSPTSRSSYGRSVMSECCQQAVEEICPAMAHRA